MTLSVVREKNYYRLASEVDATCGKVIAELKSQGLYENTLVIFTTDNGYFHAEHGLADKWYPHQESIRVPLIVHDPRMPTNRSGQTNDQFTLNADLAPTILAAANIAAPSRMQGRDFAPLYIAARRERYCRRSKASADSRRDAQAIRRIESRSALTRAET